PVRVVGFPGTAVEIEPKVLQEKRLAKLFKFGILGGFTPGRRDASTESPHAEDSRDPATTVGLWIEPATGSDLLRAVGKTTVADCASRARASGLTRSQMQELSDEALERCRASLQTRAKATPSLT